MIKPEKTETEIKKEITDFLKMCGYKVLRQHAGRVRHNMHNCEPGTPDIQAIGPENTHFFIETKRPGKDLNSNQKKVIPKLREWGHTVYVVHSVDELKHLFFTGIKQGE